MSVTDENRLEPGFLQAFRLFIVTRIVFWVVIGPILTVVQMARSEGVALDEVTNLTLIERLTLPNLAPVLLVELALLVILMLPQASRLLGKRYVPVTLAVGLAPVLVGFYWWWSDFLPSGNFIVLEKYGSIFPHLDLALCTGNSWHRDLCLRQIAFIYSSRPTLKAYQSHAKIFASTATFPSICCARCLPHHPERFRV